MHSSDPSRQPTAIHDQDARRGGFMRITNNPVAALSFIFTPVRPARADNDRRAFEKRVAKRRAKKGYK